LYRLVVAFAKDFQSSKEKEFIFYFHPKFPDFFNRLVDLLQTKDAQIIEWTFTALAFLYKYLWKELVKDIDNVYKLQLPLLASDKPEHVQLFASESFAFIGRKITDKPFFVNLVFSKLRANPQDSLGVGQLLFQVVKGVKNQFHSNLDLYLPLYLKAVSQLHGCVKEDPVFLAVEHCFLLMARHTTSMFSTQIWKLLLVSVMLTFTRFKC
jgi:U3 small nucleolar RNA-associated protein 20